MPLLKYIALGALLVLGLSTPSLSQQSSSKPATAPGTQLSSSSTVGELLDNPASRAVLERLVPVIANSPQIAQARTFPLRAIAQYAPTILTEEKLSQIDRELAVTKGATSSGKVVAAAAPSADPHDAFALKTFPLWKARAPGALGDRQQDIPTLTLVSTGETVATGAAVIVAPGGGYQALASGMEGRQVADWFAAHGVTAFVLTYRLTPYGYAHPAQLIDGKRAMRWVRANAAQYGIDPKRIGMIGFSAGGHLTAMVETQFDAGDPASPDPIERVSSRPDFAVLGYAAIDLPNNRWTQNGLIGKNTPEASLSQLRPLENIRPDTPPTFLFHTTTDELVPSDNAARMYQALVKAKVPAELHIFANGRHGLGLAMTDPALSLWPSLLQNWLQGLNIVGPQRR